MIPAGYQRGRKTGNLAYRKWFMPGGGNIPFFFFAKWPTNRGGERACCPPHNTL